jgi:hypothetical protein
MISLFLFERPGQGHSPAGPADPGCGGLVY